MAKSKAEPQTAVEAPAPAEGYLAWSRDPAVGLFAVLPLWLGYEALRFTLTPSERNGAEVLLLDALGVIGPRISRVLSVVFGVCVLAAAIRLHRREIPWLRVALVSALEGTVYGLLLGPLAAALASSAARVLAWLGPAGDRLVPELVGSLGAGIFEELVFRLALLSALVWLCVRAAVAFGMPRAVGALVAVLVSAALFALFHHIWPAGEPFTTSAFLFRGAAGVLLGLLMLVRGYGVCVYTHVLYDVHFYLTS